MKYPLHGQAIEPVVVNSWRRIMQQMNGLRAALLGTAILAGCSDADRVGTEPGRVSSATSSAVELAPQSDPNSVKQRHDVQIVSATGDIAAAVNEYRSLLGPILNPNVAGEQPGDRREINWDAPIVPATLTNNDAFPGDFFNTVSPRGVLLTTEGQLFRISDIGYIDVNPSYAQEFRAFSPRKLFTARNSTVTDVRFVVAGSDTPALVTGFGAVFADVGLADSTTTIQYFDAAGTELLKLTAPRRSDDRGLSFIGAKFDAGVVARVRITAGDTPIGADNFDNVKGAGVKRDIVVMDDFIYGEPRPIN
jgi:hypothetical protein